MFASQSPATTIERHAIIVHGLVQGVGFRPFVFGLAGRLRLSGFVMNRSGSVLIEAEGEPAALDRFMGELSDNRPPLSRIIGVERRRVAVMNERGFRIEQSDREAKPEIFISPDVAPCAACLAEMSDPGDRRYRYPFLNCTDCGPRLTIIEGAPYDRVRTTMAHFAMCPACRTEYEDPSNRRFHAEPTACPQCGPRLEARDSQGDEIATDDPLAWFAAMILQGQIGALKGLGGFHLVCDARNDHAVGELRRRKHRNEKPLAIMVRDVTTAANLCELGDNERDLLESQRRPIVLLRKRIGLALNSNRLAESISPGNLFLGVMMPYTPLHHLLLQAVGGIPLVMTSGNRSDEPIAYLDDDAVLRLGEITDAFLTHNRPIHVRCDDSVTRIVSGEELLVRRSRGYAPESIELPFELPAAMLAVGGQLKGVFALGQGRQAFLSHHLGDLDHRAAYRAFERDIELYEQLFDVRPQLIVHDVHPDYASTGYAKRRAFAEGLDLLAVQHHHAHMASCMAENGLEEPVIGVSFDGTGYGTDDAIWGGEFLVGDYSQFTRATHLRYVRMPGGEAAIREPWRMAVSHLLDAGCDPSYLGSIASGQLRALGRMIERGVNSPWTSSAGRLFDAVAAIAGVHTHVSYEGQAAMQLEWLATEVVDDRVYPFELADVIDTRSLISAVVADVRSGTSAALVARRFHSTIVEIIVTACLRIRARWQVDAVALSGGVFMNALLTSEVCARLTDLGFRVYRHRQVPANDGGLSLGQLAVAAKQVGRPPADRMRERPVAMPAAMQHS
jgi:hydrogenase maturation protein HypF